MNDLISRQEAIDEFDGVKVDEEYCNEYDIGYNDGIDFAVSRLSVLPSAPQWIPVKWHEITDEEREDEGYPKDWVAVFDSEMPFDGQKILVTTRWESVAQDECYADGEYALDSGWDWIDDVLAWMPLPGPYKEVTE